MTDQKTNRMLVILAHPDDESFAVGGTLARLAHQNVQVVLLCATRGEAGIPGLTPENAGAIREEELRGAAKQLGITVHFLGFMDGQLANTDPSVIMELIGFWIDQIRPQVILTFGPDGVSGHPDHVTISRIVTEAYDRFHQKGLLIYIYPSEATALGCGVSTPAEIDGTPLINVDISGFKLEKVRAIQCHSSQNPDLNGIPEEEVTKIPCTELYSIARKLNPLETSTSWFEKLISEG